MPLRRSAAVVLSLTGVLAAACGGSAKPRAAGSITVSAPAPSSSPSTPSEAPSSSGGTGAEPAQWLEYHGDGSRAGYSAATPKPTTLTAAWKATLDGQVYASPLVVGPDVIAATEAGTLYALDPTTGKAVWTTHLHDAGTDSTKPCGNIDPEGITGTPAADPATGLVFAVVEEGTLAARTHVLYAVNATTGALAWSKQVDAPGSDNAAMNQRGALLVANGTVYVSFGGRSGDCGNYHGSVVALPTDGSGNLVSYVVPTAREAGAWTPPGPTLAPDGSMYIAVGNGESDSTNNDPYDTSDAVIHLSATLQLIDSFSPTSWATDNANDLDLGSQGPALLPNGIIYADGKSANAYTLSAAHLGGIGGQLSTASVCASFGGTAFQADTLYVPCTNGIQQLMIAADGTITKGWKGTTSGAPVIGTGAVFSLDQTGGVLHAYESGTGATLGTVTVGATSRFATPALSGSWAYVPTLTGITAVSGA